MSHSDKKASPPVPWLPDLPIFLAGEREYRIADIMRAADVRGDLAPLASELWEGFSALATLSEEGSDVPQRELQEAVDAWRYSRDVIAAEEAEAWLTERRLTLDSLVAYAERETALKKISESRATHGTVQARDVLDALYAQLAFSGKLDTLILRFAHRAAVHVAWEAEGRKSPTEEELERKAEELRNAPKSRIMVPIAEEDDPLHRLEALYEIKLRERLTDRRLASALEGAHLDLLRFCFVKATFASSEVAMEAMFCVKEDGEQLDVVVQRAGGQTERMDSFAEDIAESLRQRVHSSRPGALLGPIPEQDGTCLVLCVESKREPKLDDPDVRSRLERRITRRVMATEIAAWVKWTAWRPWLFE